MEDSLTLRPYLVSVLRLDSSVHGACHGAISNCPAHTQDEEDELGAAVERTARVMERMAYQNSEVELLMDYKVSARKGASHARKRIDCLRLARAYALRHGDKAVLLVSMVDHASMQNPRRS